MSSIRFSFPTPKRSLKPGAGLQTFRVPVRRSGAGDDPLARIELYETGGSSPLATVLADTAVSSEVELIGHWDASLLSSLSGANVEIRVVGTIVNSGACLEVGKNTVWVTSESVYVETYPHTLAAVLAQVAAIASRQVKLAKVAPATLFAAIYKRLAASLSGALPVTPVVHEQVLKPLRAVVTTTAAVSALRVLTKAVNATLTLAATLVRSVVARIFASEVMNTTVIRAVAATYGAYLSLQAVRTMSQDRLVNLAATVAVSANLNALAFRSKLLQAVVSLPTSGGAVLQKILYAPAAIAPRIVRGIQTVVGQTLALAPNFIKELLGATEPLGPFSVEIIVRMAEVDVLSSDSIDALVVGNSSVDILTDASGVDVAGQESVMEVVVSGE